MMIIDNAVLQFNPFIGIRKFQCKSMNRSVYGNPRLPDKKDEKRWNGNGNELHLSAANAEAIYGEME